MAVQRNWSLSFSSQLSIYTYAKVIFLYQNIRYLHILGIVVVVVAAAAAAAAAVASLLENT